MKIMRVSILPIFITFIFIITQFISIPYASDKDDSVIRVAYVEGEEYFQFSNELSGIALALQELGVIDGYNLSLEETDSKKVWEALCNCKTDGSIKFEKDMYFNMSEISSDDYNTFLNSDKADLVFVMGTVAGKKFVDEEEKNDFMIFTAANAINAGLVKNETERYKNNSYAHLDLKRFKRQLDVGHKLIGFKKLGVVYEDSKEAYAYSAIDQVKEAADEYGFQVIERHVVEAKNPEDYQRYYDDLKKAYEDISDEIDCLYITTATIQDDKLEWLLEDIYANKIPTIAQSSENQVKNGAMLHVTVHDSKELGRFEARQIKKYIDGTPINELEQVYEVTPKIVLNYDVAKKVDMQIPFKILLTADKIYKTEE